MLNLMIVHLFGLLTPGPDFFYVTRMAASNSRRNCVSGIIGITLGVAFWAISAIFGLSILFHLFPWLHGTIMFMGGSYLCYLGFLLVRVTENLVFSPNAEQLLNQQSSVRKEIIKGLWINLSNAKAVVYFASVMSFVLASLTEIWQILLALAIIIVETFCYFYIISLLFSRPLAKRFYSRYSRYIDNLAGVIFLLFGGLLIYTGIAEIISY